MEACEPCSRLNSAGKPPMVCRSEAACRNVSSLAGEKIYVDMVFRHMKRDHAGKDGRPSKQRGNS